MWTHVVRELLLPPTCFLLAIPFLGALARKKKRLSLAFGSVLFGLALLLSMAPVSHFLTGLTERVPPLKLEDAKSYQPDSIVVLGAGVYKNALEMRGKTVPSNLTLERCFYAAWLSRELELPVVVCGGYGDSLQESEAFAMASALELWGVQDVHLEPESRNTDENARMSKAKLAELSLARPLLVTSASHMERARSTFARHGIETLSAPTGFRRLGPWEKGAMMFVPSEAQFHESSKALRALLAELWYKIGK